jgi:hypothetical protein
VTPRAYYTTIMAMTGYDVAVGVRDAGVCTTVHNGAGDFKFPAKVGFYGTNPVAKPVVTGSRGGNAALTSLLAALGSMGLIANNTSP